jgi:outer membrane protein assembly factor BamE
MKSSVVYSLSMAALLFVTGCSTDKIPGIYRIDIQQGNNVTQAMLNELEPGMTKNQVAYVMGNPLLIDTFHPNRWDYLYSYKPGNGDREQRRVTVFFNDDGTLSHLEGDTRTVAKSEIPEIIKEDKNVLVPLTEHETGLFDGLLDMVGLGGEEDVEILAETEESVENTESPAEGEVVQEQAETAEPMDTSASQ